MHLYVILSIAEYIAISAFTLTKKEQAYQRLIWQYNRADFTDVKFIGYWILDIQYSLELIISNIVGTPGRGF